jgi:hypothetical protein
MMIPLVATITMGRDSTYWIPLAIIWILLSPMLLLLFPLAIVKVNPFRTIGVLWQILTASKGSEFEVQLRGRTVQVSVL